MDILYAALEKRLNEEVPELRWLDWDFGQLSTPKPPVSWPCCLIDIPSAQYSNEGKLIQLGNTVITLRFGFKVYERATGLTNQPYKTQALEHLSILKKVQKALQGWDAEHFSALNRTSYARVKVIKHREYLITYESTIYDDSGRKTLKKVARPTLEIES